MKSGISVVSVLLLCGGSAQVDLGRSLRGTHQPEPAGPSSHSHILRGIVPLGIDQLGYEVQTGDRPWSFTRTGETLRFEVRSGDRRAKETEQRRPIERSEIALRTKLHFGRVYAAAYEFMVAPGPANQSSWVNVGQIHGTPDLPDYRRLGPIFAVQLDGERMRIVARSDPSAISRSRPADRWLFRDRNDLIRGHWYKMLINIKVDPTQNGRVAVWRDGIKLVDYVGPVGYNDRTGPYWKLGIYRSATEQPLTVTFKNFAISESLKVSEAVNVRDSWIKAPGQWQ